MDMTAEECRILPPQFIELPDPRKLGKADCCGDVRHPVVVAKAGVEVLLALPMVDNETQAVGQRPIAGRHYTAFPGDHVLCCIEREAGKVAE